MPRKRVLIIDDEVKWTALLKIGLDRLGTYEVREEHRGANGLAAALEFQPDLILLDVMMPDMDGGEVAAQIKSRAQFKDTPVVFLTSTVTKEEADAEHGMIGGHHFIAKPASIKDILEYIERKIGK